MLNKSDFKSLKERIEEELSALNVPMDFRSLDSFIIDGKKSAAFIRFMLNDETFDVPEEKSDLYEIAEMRARHSAVTFLVGLVFRKFGGLFDAIPMILNMEGQKKSMQMWLIASLYHDKAYSSAYIKRTALNLERTFDPFLLTDDITDSQLECLRNYSTCYPDTLAHTYADILKYDAYAINYHNSHDTKEKRDHGILGGVMMFSELANKALAQKKETELPIIKACSLAVAQHNIFKSNEKYDDDYRKFGLDTLLSSSPFRIHIEKALLLFLSLVDTIECVKKFSKSQNENRYLETLTTLKCIKMAVSEDQIVVDLSELNKEIKKKKSDELESALIDYKKALKGIGEWTDICAECGQDDNLITIWLEDAHKVNFYELASAGSI